LIFNGSPFGGQEARTIENQPVKNTPLKFVPIWRDDLGSEILYGVDSGMENDGSSSFISIKRPSPGNLLLEWNFVTLKKKNYGKSKSGS